MNEAAKRAWPLKLGFSTGEARLRVRFDDGAEGEIDYRTLRANSPSAEVRGHGAGPAPPQPPIPDDISVTQAEPVGRYAVRGVDMTFGISYDSDIDTARKAIEEVFADHPDILKDPAPFIEIGEVDGERDLLAGCFGSI